MSVRGIALGSLVVVVGLFGNLCAQVEPDRAGVGQKEFRQTELDISSVYRLPIELPAQAANEAAADLAALGVPANGGRLDVRGGRWGTLTLSRPLVPGRGVENSLAWPQGTGRSEADRKQFTWNAFTGYLRSNAARLRVDTSELSQPGRVTFYPGETVIQIHAPRVVDGIPVRGSYLNAVINHGNMVLFGSNNWGDIDVSTQPDLSEEAALEAVRAHVAPYPIGGSWGKTELIIVPLAEGRDESEVVPGRGYTHRLAWVIRPSFAGDLRSFEALVDAHTGELISFEDTNHYATTRQIQGGVYPETNNGSDPEGIEQPGWLMPFAFISNGSDTYTTDEGGNLLACVDGTVTSQLRGPYMLMNDNCGAISLSSTGDLDFGVSSGDDCTTPGLGGAGNTHSSRSGFYEMNRIIEMARAQLPGNAWLQQQLQANMNINNFCNAFWNGTVNFYRSGGGCNNTGELAGVFDHEWGHGMDANDATPGVSSPGEGIADIYAALRLDTSCIGRGFRLGNNCGGYGDPCLQCDGVRDIDWANRASGQPHDFTWANANCGGSVHCRGYVYSEAVWDLVKRDLPAAPYNLDSNTAHEIVTRLTYIGAGGVGTWFSGSPPFGGCGANSGYLNYLAADDDNGTLGDGTPHMRAIFAAFDRHEIACSTPTVQDSGCAGTPAAAPVVTATAVDRGASLSWGAVAGATVYEIYRTDGVFACDFGKTLIGETTGTSFLDSGLQNGRDYSYVVIPKGSADSCFGPASACTTVTPTGGANLQLDAASVLLTFASGDGDAYIDNCESAMVSFDVSNVGAGFATNARIDAVRAVSHPAIIIGTVEPITPSTLAACDLGLGSFDFTAAGLAFGETVVFEVDITSDELAPLVKTETLAFTNAESDLQLVASKTWDFESDLDGWSLIQGTFSQTTAGSGAGGSSGYVASSANLNNQCDQVRSPTLRLTSTSTLSVQTNFDIENFSTGSWWDRANVAIFENGGRSLVTPSGGRLYNASGPGAVCVTVNQAGWASAQTTWAGSSWTAADLGSAGRAGQEVQLDVAYGTDGSVVGRGFWFDSVTVTDVEALVADAQPDVCSSAVCGNNVLEPGEECDGSVLGVAACSDVGCAGGSVSCTSSCTLDYSSCECPVCNDNGTCEEGEYCDTCGDCVGGTSSGAVCGDGVCQAGDGENCVNCPADCNGVQSGKPANRFCCGNGGGQNPVPCSDSVCTTNGWSCTEDPQPPADYCCGDHVCEGGEGSNNCEVDCGPACNPTENPEVSCGDGVDNDCDGLVDDGDPDCQACYQPGDPCTNNSDCCSGNCKGRSGAKTCK